MDKPIILAAVLSLAACAGVPPERPSASDAPEAWRRGEALSSPQCDAPLTPNEQAVGREALATCLQEGEVAAHWLTTLDAPYLTDLVAAAIAENHALAQQRDALEIARQQVRLARAARLPGLNLALSGQRGRADDSAPVVERFDLNATAEFTLDLWGRLGDGEREALLALSAEEARYRAAERRLVADVVGASFDVAAAIQLQTLYEQRLDNLAQSLDVIDSGYRSGLNSALDVYLARNTLEQERANVANQRQQRMGATVSLELLLADYPDGQLDVGEALPELAEPVAAGAPSELLQRRPDVQRAWFELLAADAAVAVAHKNRFPSFALSANARDSTDAFGQLLSGGALAWSTAASLIQPLFQGGRLLALHEQARRRLSRAERRYLETVYQAFSEVELELSRTLSLQARHAAFDNAKANAEAALTLAFDQYQRGLVGYTAVLESQRRAFDAQTTVIELRNQLLQSRVALLLALGGEF